MINAPPFIFSLNCSGIFISWIYLEITHPELIFLPQSDLLEYSRHPEWKPKHNHIKFIDAIWDRHLVEPPLWLQRLCVQEARTLLQSWQLVFSDKFSSSLVFPPRQSTGNYSKLLKREHLINLSQTAVHWNYTSKCHESTKVSSKWAIFFLDRIVMSVYMVCLLDLP